MKYSINKIFNSIKKKKTRFFFKIEIYLIGTIRKPVLQATHRNFSSWKI